jgi:xanthine dehydrogenase small subunit
MGNGVSFVQNGRIVELSFDDEIRPTTTVLNYLRQLPDHKGTKEGCAEGDCGACTVVLGGLTPEGTIRYRAVDSCLVFLPMLHGRQLITVEAVKHSSGELHPVQRAMVETGGSQCGYCTPGFIMSLFALYKRETNPSRVSIDDALTGNLCRCTGYRPIVEAASRACVSDGLDHFAANEPNVRQLLQSIPRSSISIHTPGQQYWKPATLAEALTLKHDYPDALIISGATDVALRVTKKHELLNNVIDCSSISDLQQIKDTSDSTTVGAGVTLEDLMPWIRETFLALHSMLTVFGSQQIRNLATLGGNLGTASPIGDTLPVLMAYRASVVLESVGGRREVPIDEFIVGYRKTTRRPDELITAIVLPKLTNGALVKSYKISKRKDLDISTVSAAFRLERNAGTGVTSVVTAYGGMADRVRRAARVEHFLAGKPWERSTIEQAMELIDEEFTPISDARSGAEFRRIAAKNLLLKFWSETATEAHDG